MALVLAIDPDRKQADVLERLTRDLVGHDLVVAASNDEALEVIDRNVPDLILVPLFLSPGDETSLMVRLRELSGVDDLQTLTIPLLAANGEPSDTKPRWFYWFKPPAARASEQACDAHLFAEQIRTYLERRSPPISPPSPPPSIDVVADEAPSAVFGPGVAARTERVADQEPPKAISRPAAATPVVTSPRPAAAKPIRPAAVPKIRPIVPPRQARSWRAQWKLPLAAAVALVFALGVPAPANRFTAQPVTGTVKMESVPTGSQVWVDGKALGTTPLSATLSAGAHQALFRRRGATRTVSLEILAGAQVVARVDWTRKPKGRATSDPEGATVAGGGGPRRAATDR